MKVIHYPCDIWSGMLSFISRWLVVEEFTNQHLGDYFSFSEFWRFILK